MYGTSERVVEPERVSVRCEIERTECRPLFSAETDAQVDPRELTPNGFSPGCYYETHNSGGQILGLVVST